MSDNSGSSSGTPEDVSSQTTLLLVAAVSMTLATICLAIIVRVLERCIRSGESTGVEPKVSPERRLKLLNAHSQLVLYSEYVSRQSARVAGNTTSDASGGEAVASGDLCDGELGFARQCDASRRIDATEPDCIGSRLACECSVCLAEFVGSDEVRELPCGHLFHDSCLQSWFVTSQVKPNCPSCRSAQLRTPSESLPRGSICSVEESPGLNQAVQVPIPQRPAESQSRDATRPTVLASAMD